MINLRLVSCGVLIGLTVPGTVSGQNYPSKPVRFISPGTGATELVTRIVAQGLTERLGQQFFVDVRVGASGNIGAETAARAPADGYSLFLATQPHTVNVSLYKGLSYDFIRDFAPITRMTSSPHVVVVHPSLPVKSISDLVKLAKAKPGVIDYASAGVGGPTSLAAELFKVVAGVNLVDVPYKGGTPAETALVAGETPLYFGPVATLLPFVKAGRVRAVAVTTAQRLPSLPQVQTVAESGYPGYEYANWHGLAVPVKTPREIQGVLLEATLAVLKRPEIAKRFEDLGLSTVGNRPEEFVEFIKADTEKWRKIIQQRGIRIE
jgi:tripartite-type tricarboxylate transporter receptor subunit TctC